MVVNAVECDLAFVRHGHAHTGGEQYGNDIARVLSATGHVQAETLATHLRSWGPSKIVASPFLRARETAKHVRGATGAFMYIDDGLRERHFGALEGLTLEGITARYGAGVAATLSRSEELELEGEEPFLAAAARVFDCTRRIVLESGGDRVVAVSHGGPHSWLMCGLLQLTFDRLRLFHLDPAHYSVLRLRATEETLNLVEIKGMNIGAPS